MRLVFFTEDEAILLAPMLDRVLAACSEHECRVYVFRRPAAGRLRDLRWATRTFGMAYTVLTGAEYVYRRLLDAGERLGLWRAGRAPSVAAAARRRGVALVRW